MLKLTFQFNSMSCLRADDANTGTLEGNREAEAEMIEQRWPLYRIETIRLWDGGIMSRKYYREPDREDGALPYRCFIDFPAKEFRMPRRNRRVG